MNTTVKTDFILQHDGRDIYVEISPCSWMYPTYGLQIKIASKPHACNAESIFDRDCAVNACDLSPEKLTTAAHAQATRWLQTNGMGGLDAKVAKWAKDRVRLDAAINKAQAKEEKARIKRLTKRQTEGCTHVVDSWIHPSNGDDYQTEVCLMGEPTPEDIKRILTKSCVKTDYKVTPIAELLKA